jgi:hypothetical protein
MNNIHIMRERERERERERIMSRCNSCRILIHEGEFAYIFVKGKKIEQPRWVKCEDCYKQLQTKVEEYKSSVSKWWKWGSIGNGVLSMIIGFIKKDFFRKERRYLYEERIVTGYIRDGFKWKIAGFLLGAVGCFIIVSLIIWITRLIWRPYGSTIRKLVYSVKEVEKEEAKKV